MKRHVNLRVLARFRPTTTDDLASKLINLVGEKGVFRYYKFIDDDDTPYSNQWLLIAEDKRFGNYWFSECDLEILQEKQST
jgi:hypothetical protein